LLSYERNKLLRTPENFFGCSATSTLASLGATNSGHTATLRSAQMLGFASHFVCPQPLGKTNHEMGIIKDG